MKCDYCNYENPNNVKLCLKCGKELPDRTNLSTDSNINTLPEIENNSVGYLNEVRKNKEDSDNKKSKRVAVMLSVMPGLGQYYLNYKKRSLVTFIISLILLIPTFWIIWPIWWFYNLYDAARCADAFHTGTEPWLFLFKWNLNE